MHRRYVRVIDVCDYIASSQIASMVSRAAFNHRLNHVALAQATEGTRMLFFLEKQANTSPTNVVLIPLQNHRNINEGVQFIEEVATNPKRYSKVSAEPE